MSRFMEHIDLESTEKVRVLMREVRNRIDGVEAEPKKKVVVVKKKEDSTSTQPPITWAKPWRQIAEPHPDVAQGRYRQAEFAADLSQVLRGEAELEYQDPVEFFDRTYITAGMKNMLVKAVQRICGKGGEPVIQLKTSFGGGKTHSMLALYHLAKAGHPETLNGMSDVFNTANITSLPRINPVVLVGTALDSTKSSRPSNLPGVTINTLWGEMTAQLAISAGKPELYNLVKNADRNGVSPGSQTIKQILDECGACLILIDELVAYARKLYGAAPGASAIPRAMSAKLHAITILNQKHRTSTFVLSK
jgi:predicted AAA+ superfamily ATPase